MVTIVDPALGRGVFLGRPKSSFFLLLAVGLALPVGMILASTNSTSNSYGATPSPGVPEELLVPVAVWVLLWGALAVDSQAGGLFVGERGFRDSGLLRTREIRWDQVSDVALHLEYSRRLRTYVRVFLREPIGGKTRLSYNVAWFVTPPGGSLVNLMVGAFEAAGGHSSNAHEPADEFLATEPGIVGSQAASAAQSAIAGHGGRFVAPRSLRFLVLGFGVLFFAVGVGAIVVALASPAPPASTAPLIDSGTGGGGASPILPLLAVPGAALLVWAYLLFRSYLFVDESGFELYRGHGAPLRVPWSSVRSLEWRRAGYIRAFHIAVGYIDQDGRQTSTLIGGWLALPVLSIQAAMRDLFSRSRTS